MTKKRRTSSLNLFDPIVSAERQHTIFKQICEPQFAPERAVLADWSKGFVDRDGKFVQEFQTSFESSMWELYVYACIRALGGTVDFLHASPDFVTSLHGHNLCIEATIARPPAGAQDAYGAGPASVPDDLTAFNLESTLRLCNSFTAKADKFNRSYSVLPHVQGKPYVIAIASFDRPNAHLAANRPIIAALYGIYFDEAETLATQAPQIIRYPVDGVRKTPTAAVLAGYFANCANAHVSAVIYSPVATWGKIRALADAPNAKTIYTTFHPNPTSLLPSMRRVWKSDYAEHLLDGLYIFHNPFARLPLDHETLGHERVAQIIIEGDELVMLAPDDFLLMRLLHSVATI